MRALGVHAAPGHDAAARSVSGQIFGVQGNDISVMSQIRSVDYREKAGGWSPASILGEALPELAPSFTPLGGGAGGFTRPSTKAAAPAAS